MNSPVDPTSPPPPESPPKSDVAAAEAETESGGLTESDSLKRRIIKQVEYYFSDENLPTDKHMLSLIHKNKQGFVPLPVIASFRKMKKLTTDNALVATALRDSSFLVVSADGKKVKRLVPFPLASVRDSQFYTVLVENLPEDHSVDNIRRIFGEAGNVKNVCIRDPQATVESSKVDKGEKFISCKLHALVEFETVEAAEKAVATLNNEQDWRSGMRVKLLKKMVKHGQKKQAWREPEKDHVSGVPDQSGDEGNHNSSELHDDAPDEENGAHSYKEKHEMKSRNRGRSGRQKHHGGANGMGHGTARSNHTHEPAKPPPGPRMPDGTRGFTMGRGRPLTSDNS